MTRDQIIAIIEQQRLSQGLSARVSDSSALRSITLLTALTMTNKTGRRATAGPKRSVDGSDTPSQQ